jgi:hypothetical protein
MFMVLNMLYKFPKISSTFLNHNVIYNSCYYVSLNTAYVWKVLRLNELQTNQKYPASYKDVVQHVHENIQHHHTELWATGKWFLLYDSVICQTIFVSSSNCCIATYIIYSRFVTLHFFLLPQLK